MKMSFKKCVAIVFFGIMTSAQAYAASIVNIAPSITQTTLRSDGLTEVIFTATNNTNKVLSNLTITPAYNSQGRASGITLLTNNCNTLQPGASCTFQVLIQGANQPSSFIVSPRVCAFNGAVCSQPIASNRLTVNVNAITHPLFAYVGPYSGANADRLVPIQVSNLTLGTPLTSFSFGTNGLQGTAVSPNGNVIYVSNDDSNTVDVVSAGATPSRLARITVGSSPAGLAFTPNGLYILVANFDSGTVSVINTATNAVVNTINVGVNPNTIAISPDGSKAYVTNFGSNSVSVIDIASGQVSNTIAVGNGPTGIAITPDGTRVYVCNRPGNSISIINTSSQTIVGTIQTTQPLTIVISPDGTRAYVADFTTGRVTVINLSNNSIIAAITFTGLSKAIGVALTPAGDTLFVTAGVGTGNAVGVINTATNSVIANVSVGGEQVTVGNFVG